MIYFNYYFGVKKENILSLMIILSMLKIKERKKMRKKILT